MSELQETASKLNKDLRQVNGRLASCQREYRANQVTSQQIAGISDEIPMYRTLGRCFMYTPRPGINARLMSEEQTLSKNQNDLSDRKEYLERRVESNMQHMKDILAGV